MPIISHTMFTWLTWSVCVISFRQHLVATEKITKYGITLRPLNHFHCTVYARWWQRQRWRVQGGEDVFMCMRSRGEHVDIRHYTTMSHVNPTEVPDPHIGDKQWELRGDSRLACRFSRPVKITGENLDLGNMWYQLYAWGEVSQCQSLFLFLLPSSTLKQLQHVVMWQTHTPDLNMFIN